MDYYNTQHLGVAGPVWELFTILGLVALSYFFIRSFLSHLEETFKKERRFYAQSFVKALRLPLRGFVWFTAACMSLDLIFSQLEGFYFPLNSLLTWGVLGFITWFLFRWKNELITTLMRSPLAHNREKKHLIDALAKVGTILICILMLLFSLDALGLSITALVAFGGVGGIALAFASQEIIANFFGGFMVYLNRPFVIGDWVMLPVQGIEGIVEEIGWHNTLIRSLDKKAVYIPNALMIKNVIINPSRMTHREFNLLLPLRRSDLPLIPAVIEKAEAYLKNHPLIDQEEKVAVILAQVGNASFDIGIQAYTPVLDSLSYAKLKGELIGNLSKIIMETGADFAFPTTEIRWNPSTTS